MNKHETMRISRRGCGPVTPLLLLLLLLLATTESCSPGRGSGRRRRPRKLTPLVFKQHVPNVSENTLGASGLTDGRIRRHEPKFKDLVRNNNPDILFKDEEGTGADRIMSQRCKDKLNTLAISVLNQWPGVKLRVTEAWDEDGMHAENSLHYEGRAVDITTSDRDRSKYGMLARLAVEAGFDWVYYETRGHIHCSVKSDSSVAIKIGGCFPPHSLVLTHHGHTVPMTEVHVGDRVLSMRSDGQLVYSDVVAFLDRSASQVGQYYSLSTESGRQITLTAKHLIYVTGGTPDDVDSLALGSSSLKMSSSSSPSSPFFSDTSVSPSVVFAEEVRVGQYLILAHTDGTDFVLPPHHSAGDVSPTDDVSQTGGVSQTDGASSSPRRGAGRSTSAPQDIDKNVVYTSPPTPSPSSSVGFTRVERVVSVSARSMTGVYAPLTSHGTIVVDGVVTSCYAFIKDERLAHGVFAPVRAYHVMKTLVSDWLREYYGPFFSWIEKLAIPVLSPVDKSLVAAGNGTVCPQQDGAHWYARALYSVAINVLGMDLTIAI